jgi:hypothetical protein
MMIIDDWLEDRISERRFQFEPAADTDEFAMFAGMLRAEALASGYTLEALEKACGGDISTYVWGKMRSRAAPAVHVASTPAVEAAYAPA